MQSQTKIPVDRKFNYDVQRAICKKQGEDNYYNYYNYKYSQNHDIFNRSVQSTKQKQSRPFTAFILKYQKQPFSEQIDGFQDYQLHYDLQRSLLQKLPIQSLNKRNLILPSFKLYMIHHLFNSTEFTKQDFLLEFDSLDFQNIKNTYGSVVLVYKMELRVPEDSLQVFQTTEEYICDLVKESRSKQEVANITSNINNNLQTITLQCNLDTIRQYMEQLPEVQHVPLQNTIQVIQFLQSTILSNKSLKILVNPEYIGVRQKTNDSYIRPYLWVEQFII